MYSANAFIFRSCYSWVVRLLAEISVLCGSLQTTPLVIEPLHDTLTIQIFKKRFLFYKIYLLFINKFLLLLQRLNL